jgi:hypothetical protein
MRSATATALPARRRRRASGRASGPSVCTVCTSALLCAALGGALAGCGGAEQAGPPILRESASVTSAAANPVTVSPLPGTPDASAATQISFLGARGTRVARVRAVGSLSGAHAGALRAYSTGTGESFLPAQPFVPGETVTVTARVFPGGRGARVARTSFTIARQAPVLQKGFPVSRGDPDAVQHYETEPAITPSTVTITHPAAPGAAPGDLLLAPYQSAGSPGPMIADQRGGLIWFRPLAPGRAAANLAVQRYRGQNVLTWWQGRILQIGFGQGEDVVYDSSYRRIASIRAGNGYAADLHAFHLTPQGTAWLDAFDPVRANLRSVGGISGGVLSDSVIQEIDVPTGLVMWEWHALGHIPPSDSKNPVTKSSYPWDYVHLNSIDPGREGDLLLSFRNTWSVDDVDIHTGAFRWRIGGSRATLALPSAATFYWQHDAAFQPGGRISLFDNGSDPPKERQSRALLLAPDLRRHRVALVASLANPSRTLLASSQGNAQSLGRGAWLLGYGGLPNFTELDGGGRVLLDGTLGPDVQSYTARIADWHGHPLQPPAVRAGRSPDRRPRLLVSWNGATDVAAWRLELGPAEDRLTPVATAPRTGFQTAIEAARVVPGARLAAAQALGAHGRVLGTSAAVPLPG